MATGEIGTSSEHPASGRPSHASPLRMLLHLLPSLLVIAALFDVISCGSNGLLDAAGNGGSATATATTGTGTLAFVTNFNDAKVSSFTRNTTTGALKHTGQVTAGKKSGPRGLVTTPNGEFLYVANVNDNNIYEFSVNANNGTLSALTPPSVSNGNGTQPDELAISPNGTLLWATGRAGTVTNYTINTSTGQLTLGGSIAGFNTPFGIVVHPTLAVIYVSDLGTGLIQPMTYNTGSGALTKNFSAVHSSDPNANMPAALTLDSGGDALFAPDEGNGEVSSFSVDTNTGVPTPILAAANSSVSDAPLGIGIAVNAGNEFVFTGNFGGSSISSFLVTSSTNVISPPTIASGFNAAKGLVVDPQNLFVYTADSGDGTVGMATINGSCGGSICAGTTTPTENPANSSSGPFGITLAQ